jgi:hypothetical protein
MKIVNRDLFLTILYIFIFLGVNYFFAPFLVSNNVLEQEKISLENVNQTLPANLIGQQNITYENESIDTKYISAIKYGTLWYYNNQNDNFLNYEYDINSDSYSQDTEELRVVASMWAIAKSGNFTNIKAFKDLAIKGFDYYKGFIRESKQDDLYYINIPKNNPNIAYSAFMILSLLEMDYKDKDLYLDKLANGIIHQQQSNGSIGINFFNDDNSNIDYYPGEALIAIAKLYEYKPDQKYLDFLNKAFVYYRDYWRKNINFPFIPWQSRAYAKLYQFTDNKEVADFVFEMNDYLIDQQPKSNTCSGFAFYDGIAIAVRMEGMNQAYATALKAGDTKRANCYAEYVKEASNYILNLQTKKFAGINKRAIGGFLQKENVLSHRVDRNQHAIMALIEGVELGILK